MCLFNLPNKLFSLQSVTLRGTKNNNKNNDKSNKNSNNSSSNNTSNKTRTAAATACDGRLPVLGSVARQF